MYINRFNNSLKAILFFLTVFVAVNTKGQTVITALGTTVSEDFNSVTALTSGSTWTNNSTLPGWYASINSTILTTIYANTGSTITAGRLYGFASTGSQEKALGIIVSGTTGSTKGYVGWRLKNTTGTTIRTLRVSWTGEQWNKYLNGSLSQYIYLYYKKNTTVTTLSEAGYSTGSSSFQALQTTSVATTALDGNASANRTETYVLLQDVNVPNNTEIMLRWELLKYSNPHSLAIDDVSVTALMDQEITFDPFNDVTYGQSPITLTATSSSGLPVTYSSSNLNVATVSGNVLTIVGPGTVDITASQAGNDTYNSATAVSSLNVRPKSPEVTPATLISSDRFTANWTADNGLNDAGTTYIVTYSTDKNFDEVTPGVTISTSETPDKFFELSPDNGYPLTQRTIYYYKVYAISNGVYSDYSPSAAITTGTNFVSQADGLWDTNASWETNDSPAGIANNVTVRNLITSPNTSRDSIIINGLIVESTGKLSNSELMNVTNKLTIQVDENGTTGKILNNSTLNLGNAANIVVRKSFAAGQWHFVGFPFNITSVLKQDGSPATWGDLGETSADFIVQRYNGAGRASAGIVNTTGEGLNWANVSPQQFTARTGYIIYTPSAITLDFVTPAKNKLDIFKTSSNVAIGLYPSSISSLHSGWNLTASPFVSSYDLYNSTVNAPYYVYNGVNYDYIMSSDHYYLQPFSSFFLQARSTNFSYSNSGRMLLSKDVSASSVDYDEIGLKLKNTTYSDVTRIRLKTDASTDYEIGNDAVKMFSMNSSVPQIYSVLNNISYAVNAVPYETKEFTFYTKIGTAGNYTLELLPEYFAPNCTAVQVYDKVANKTVNLKTSGSYTFTSSAGTANRFKVTVTTNSTDVTTSTTTLDNSTVSVFVSNNEAHFYGLTKDVNVNIFDVSGKLIQRFTNVKNQQILKIDKKGLLLFEVISDDNTYIKLKALNK